MAQTKTTQPGHYTVTFTRSGQGAGHASTENLIPRCGANVNKPGATPQIQAHGWTAVTCKRCRKIVDIESSSTSIATAVPERNEESDFSALSGLLAPLLAMHR